MSDALLPLRLRWHGGKGLAKGHSAMMSLSAPPVLGFPFVELDYAPGACMQLRVEPWQPVRDMQPAEVDACARFLRALGDEDVRE